tara:strand:- start:68716 stop:69195 length:480 start_codon:yes stop_codon:yes gene_type:complete
MKDDHTWNTGAGEALSFSEIVDIIKDHTEKDGQVSVGSDSFIRKQECIFSTAICLYGADGQSGGRYFIRRVTFKKKRFSTLLQRIMKEVQDSVEIGMVLLEHNPVIDIDIHLDVSATDRQQATSRFSDMLVGYAKGAGFNCKIKPHAFAAASIADKHSK